MAPSSFFIDILDLQIPGGSFDLLGLCCPLAQVLAGASGQPVFSDHGDYPNSTINRPSILGSAPLETDRVKSGEFGSVVVRRRECASSALQGNQGIEAAHREPRRRRTGSERIASAPSFRLARRRL